MVMILTASMGLFDSEKRDRKQLARLQSDIMKKEKELSKWQSELDRTTADLNELKEAQKTLQSSIEMEKNQKQRKANAKEEIKRLKGR
jgi:septal ring factor EnvC (AmiA/AmiB activator)